VFVLAVMRYLLRGEAIPPQLNGQDIRRSLLSLLYSNPVAGSSGQNLVEGQNEASPAPNTATSPLRDLPSGVGVRAPMNYPLGSYHNGLNLATPLQLTQNHVDALPMAICQATDSAAQPAQEQPSRSAADGSADANTNVAWDTKTMVRTDPGQDVVNHVSRKRSISALGESSCHNLGSDGDHCPKDENPGGLKRRMIKFLTSRDILQPAAAAAESAHLAQRRSDLEKAKADAQQQSLVHAALVNHLQVDSEKKASLVERFRDNVMKSAEELGAAAAVDGQTVFRDLVVLPTLQAAEGAVKGFNSRPDPQMEEFLSSMARQAEGATTHVRELEAEVSRLEDSVSKRKKDLNLLQALAEVDFECF